MGQKCSNIYTFNQIGHSSGTESGLIMRLVALTQPVNLVQHNIIIPVEIPQKKVVQQSLQVETHQKHFETTVQLVALHENGAHKQLSL